MSSFGKFLLTGKDAQRAADWLFTNDVGQEGMSNMSCLHEVLQSTLHDMCLVVSCFTVPEQKLTLYYTALLITTPVNSDFHPVTIFRNEVCDDERQHTNQTAK